MDMVDLHIFFSTAESGHFPRLWRSLTYSGLERLKRVQWPDLVAPELLVYQRVKKHIVALTTNVQSSLHTSPVPQRQLRGT